MNAGHSRRSQIVIDRLHIRLRGLDAAQARAAVDGLGEQVLRQISAGQALPPAGQAQVETIHLTTQHLDPAATPGDLREAIARAVAAAVARSAATGPGNPIV